MRVLGLAASLLVMSFAPALADNNVLCVQSELAARGYSPGPLDGQIGVQTLSAARASGFSSSPLTVANAGSWCQALRAPQRSFAFGPPDVYQPAFVQRLDTRVTYNSFFSKPTVCPVYLIDANDPCY